MRGGYKNPVRNRERRNCTPIERNRSISSARFSAVNEISSKNEIPRIRVGCSFRKEDLLAVPDTGATRTILPLSAVPGHLIRAYRTRLSPANGTQMETAGEILFTATVGTGPEATINALVSPDLFGPALKSWHDLMALGVLSSNFPKSKPNDGSAALVLATATDNLMAIRSDFVDVLCDSLGDASGTLEGNR